MAISELLKTLPPNLSKRFEGLVQYVKLILEEEGIAKRLKPEQIEVIQITILVESLADFMEEGSRAAAAAVDAFTELGVPSFRIGSEEFAGRNEAVTRGVRLSQQLRAAADLPESLGGTRSQFSVRYRVLQMGKEVADGKDLG